MNKKVLVFGGSGLVGQGIINQLINQNFEIINIDIKDYTNNYSNYQFYYSDLSKFKNSDQLFNLFEEHIEGLVAIINASLLSYPEYNLNSLKKDDIVDSCASLFAIDMLICNAAVKLSSTINLKNNISIILISSVKAIMPAKFRHYIYSNNMSSSPFYGCMKAASAMLIKDFATRYKNQYLTFNGIAPGGIKGELHQDSFIKEYRKSTSNIDFIDPNSIGSTVCWMISLGESINGTITTVDAGWSCD